MLILTLKVCPDFTYFYQVLSSHSSLVTVLPPLRCKNVLISPALYSMESNDIHWYAGSSVLPWSLILLQSQNKLLFPPQQLQASFHSSALSLASSVSQPEVPPHSCRSWELLVLPFSCHLLLFQQTWCLRVFCLSSAEPGSSWLRR